MRILVFALVLLIGATGVNAQQKKKSAWQKFTQMFQPKPTPKPKKKIVRQKKPEKYEDQTIKLAKELLKEQRTKDGFFIVDAQWLANYREQEFAWSYPIPEDDEIRFRDGQYHIPPVVYRHFEDMSATPRPDR